MEYITKAQVDEILGIGWQGDGDAGTAVQMSNDWLFARSIPTDVDDDRITRAGAQIAKLAASGGLYADSDGRVKREMVRADTVEVETEFMDGSTPTVGAMQYVKDLLAPWLSPFGGSVTMLRRL